MSNRESPGVRRAKAKAAELNGDGKGDAYEGDGPEPAAPKAAIYGAKVVKLATVPRREVDWLWPARIPCGAVTLLDGDPGLGKSWLTLDLAARVSRGAPMPAEWAGASHPVGSVLLLSAEDDLGNTIRPRLEALGADLERITAWEEVRQGNTTRPPTLPEDLPLLGKCIRDLGNCRLVVLDPLMAYLSGEVDSHKDSDVRRVMYELRRLAEEHQVAIVIVRHLNKLVNVSDPLYRGGGSIGIIGAARSALIVGLHPEDDSQRVLARTKGNLCAEPDALAYTIAAKEDGSAALDWQGAVDLGASDLLSRRAADQKQERERRSRDAIARFLGALDRIDPEAKGAPLRRLRSVAGMGHELMDRVVVELVQSGQLVECEVEVEGGRGSKQVAAGVRRASVG